MSRMLLPALPLKARLGSAANSFPGRALTRQGSAARAREVCGAAASRQLLAEAHRTFGVRRSLQMPRVAARSTSDSSEPAMSDASRITMLEAEVKQLRAEYALMSWPVGAWLPRLTKIAPILGFMAFLVLALLVRFIHGL
ncbi:hypothetical protein TSOC_002420 [Tetrabaena socialis]|uniref:Uncharacterized protein n=1 Tax=Tetrabaena socialis TaxID=47790 RepID=A0A2J8AE39_9CHLO|nr:hypothetical protein TSOC_002420 [Tetrabaena socialis]|eukprot:PNH10791.1 hypothetical protein TSOC_002420 [Tetrabaena socialis]